MRKAVIRLACMAVPFIGAAPAAAQEPAQSSTYAQSHAETPGATIGDIVVTARRVSENIQDVPVSVQNLDANSLTQRGITRVQDLITAVPSLQVNSNYGDVQPSFTLRGVGPANLFGINVSSQIGVYVDEVYEIFRHAQGLQMFDLQRVEVVKGPQGTLFGRNTTGGAISFYTRKPMLDGEAHGYFGAGYGNFDRVNFEAASDITIVPDALGLRISGVYKKGDGSIKNVTGGPDFASVDNKQVRAILRAKPASDFDITASIAYSRDNPISMGQFVVGLGPDGAFPIPGLTQTLGKFESGATDTHHFRVENFASMLRMEKGLGDDLQLVSVSAYSDNKLRQVSDCDGAPARICFIAANFDGKEFSQDLRLSYARGSTKGTVGVYYAWDKLIGHDSAVDIFIPIGGPSYLYSLAQKRTSFAVYGEGTVEIVPQLNLSLGARYTWDDSKLYGYQAFLLSGPGGTPTGMAVPGSATPDPSLFVPANRQKDSYLSWRAMLDYHFTPDIMAFASVSRGYRSGNFNAQAFSDASELVYAPPERADTYELGFKSSLLDRRLRFNGGLFYTDYHGQQVQDTIGGIRSALNSLDGKIKGAEFEISFAATPMLILRANGSFLKSHYGDQTTFTGFNIKGERFPFAPNESFMLGFDWTPLRTDTDEIRITGNAAYTGDYTYQVQGSQGQSPNGRFLDGSPSYWLVDGRIAYRKDRYEIALWGKNLFNKQYFPYWVNSQGLGIDTASYGTPRTYGVTLRADI